MIIVIFVIGLIALIAGVWIHENTRNENLGVAVGVVGGFTVGIAAIVIIILSTELAPTYKIDEKIALYESENAQIEESIAIAVEKYMEHESGVFADCTPESALTLVSVYPELKSDSLIKKQIDMYVSNRLQIKILKEKQINAPLMKWWLYFGN